MAQLGGRSQRVTISTLELLADESGLVLDFARESSGSALIIKARKPWESRWSSNLPTFTVNAQDAAMLGKLVNGYDAWYERDQLNQIPANDFTGENPNPPEPTVDPNCAPLDIERAKAANLAEERELLRLANLRDHSNDKHVYGLVEGCEKCYPAEPFDGTHFDLTDEDEEVSEA